MKRPSKRDPAFDKRETPAIQIEQIDQEADIGSGSLLRVYRVGACTAYVGQTPWGWHMAIRHPSRFPTWEEVATARYELIHADVTMGLILPPDPAYLQTYPNMLQLWETRQHKREAPADD